VKIVPGVFVVYFALKRDWGAVLRCGLGFVLTVVVGALVSPSASLRYWSGGFMALGRWGEDPVGVLNQSFNGVWLRHAGEQQASTLVTVALCLAGVGVGAVVAARRLRRADDLGAVLALGLGGLLASPISWPHHWLWVIPMLMLLVARGRTAWAWVFGVLFCTDPLLLLAGPDAAQALQLPGWQQLVAALYVMAGVLALAVIDRTPAPDPAPVSRAGEAARLPGEATAEPAVR
jgi:alpha-1,2-mannosyltransferase